MRVNSRWTTAINRKPESGNPFNCLSKRFREEFHTTYLVDGDNPAAANSMLKGRQSHLPECLEIDLVSTDLET